MSIRWASSSAGSVKGAWDVQGGTSSTWNSRLVALFADVVSFGRMLDSRWDLGLLPLLFECYRNRKPFADGFLSEHLLHWQIQAPAGECHAARRYHVHWYDHCHMAIEVTIPTERRRGSTVEGDPRDRDDLEVGGHCCRHCLGCGGWHEGSCLPATCKPTLLLIGMVGDSSGAGLCWQRRCRRGWG
jgi:hypothetical protein